MRDRPSPPSLDEVAFTRLLARLHDDPERAGVEYESLRRTLLRFFDWRGVPTADAAADDTLDRLARRLAAGEPVADVRAFALGIARLVALERYRRPDARHEPIDPVVGARLAAPTGHADDDQRQGCFDGCFGELADDVRGLIVRYYADAGRPRIDARAALAQELRLSPNALRLRAQRVRDRLEACIMRCLSGGAAAAGHGEPSP